MRGSRSRRAPCSRGEVAVRQVGARRVALHRLPPAAPPPQPEPPFSLPKLPELPGSLPQVAIDRLFVDALELGQPVLGEAATFALDGNATTGADGRRAQARACRCAGRIEPTAELGLAAGLDLAAQSLSIDLTGSETGGLLAAVSGRPEAGALRLSLKGQGPLSGWQGRLAVDAERLAKLDLAVDLAYADQKRLAVTGALDAAPGALPADTGRGDRHPCRAGAACRRDRARALCGGRAAAADGEPVAAGRRQCRSRRRHRAGHLATRRARLRPFRRLWPRPSSRVLHRSRLSRLGRGGAAGV